MGRLAGLLVTVAVLAGCAAAPDCERIPGVRPGVCPLPVADRQPAPDVVLPVIVSSVAAETDPLAGVTELSLSDLRGRVVVVNFWASWCGPCRVEQPDLNAAWELFPADEVVVIGVNIEDTRANALAHLEEFGVPYFSLFDPVNELAGRFSGIGARTIPTTLFLDTDGRVAARLLGLTDTREIVALTAAIVEGPFGLRRVSAAVGRRLSHVDTKGAVSSGEDDVIPSESLMASEQAALTYLKILRTTVKPQGVLSTQTRFTMDQGAPNRGTP